jgi:chromosome segregation ATPase
MTAIKAQMADNLKNKLNPLTSPVHKEVSQINDAMQAMLSSEVDRIKKEAREAAKGYERKLQEKSTKINDLQTDVENLKTDLKRTQGEMGVIEQENSLLVREVEAFQAQIQDEQLRASEARAQLAKEAKEKGEKVEEIRWLKQELQIIKESREHSQVIKQ